ncbi:unnamed protein product, partial [Didymodactylos carnosus]
AIFHEAEPSSNLPKRKYLMTNILQHMYNEIRDLVIEQLKDSLGICITTDNWTSDCNQPYITVSSHLITSNYELKTFVLQTTQFSGNHTADRITQALQDICIEWGILDKIVCLVSDNCSTIKKVGRDFKKDWFGCADHNINLCVVDAYELDDVKLIAELLFDSRASYKRILFFLLFRVR